MLKHELLLSLLYVCLPVYALPTPEHPRETQLSPGSIAAICCIAIILILILILLFITRRVFLIHRQLDISRSIIEDDLQNPSQFSNKSGILVGLLGSPGWESRVSGTLSRISAGSPKQNNSRRPSYQSHSSRSHHDSGSSRTAIGQYHQHRRTSSESEHCSSITRPKRARTSSSSHSSHRSRHSHIRRSLSLKRTPSQPSQPKQRAVSFDDSALQLISFSLEDLQHPPLPTSSEQFTLPMLQASSPLSPLNVYEAAFRHSTLQRHQDFLQISYPYALGKHSKSPGTHPVSACTESAKENLANPTVPFFCDPSGDESHHFISDATFSPPLTSTPKLPVAAFAKPQPKSRPIRTRRAPSRQPSPLRNTVVVQESIDAPTDAGTHVIFQDSPTMHSGDVLDIIKELVNETATWHNDLFMNKDFKSMVGRESKDNLAKGSFSPPLVSYPSMELYDGSTWFDLPEIDESPEYELEEEKSVDHLSRYSSSLHDGQSVVGVAQ